MKTFNLLSLLLICFTLTACSWLEPEKEYIKVYVKPDLANMQQNCSISKLDKPPTQDTLLLLKTDEARFIYMSGLYIQSIGVFGTCIETTKGVINEVDKFKDEKSEGSK